MPRVRLAILSTVALWILLVAPSTNAALAPEPAPIAAECIPAAKCCKICDAGQACGNSCISRSKQCRKGRGCACNASELCP